MTLCTDDPRELLAALREVEPTPDEIERVRAAARARDAHPRRSAFGGPLLRPRRLALVAVAAIAAGVVTATLPGDERAGSGALAALEAAAAAAADQPGPAAFMGYRYVELFDRQYSPWHVPSEACAREMTREAEEDQRARGEGRTSPRRRSICPPERSARFVEESRQELWIDARFEGVRRDHGSKIVETIGDPELGESLKRELGRKPATIRYVYGDGPFAKVPVEDLPTDPDALLRELRAAYADGRWAENPRSYGRNDRRPREDREYELAVFTVHLIAELNVTPELRAAGFRLLARLPGVVDLGEITDQQGRKGHGFELRSTVVNPMGLDEGARRPVRLRVVFDEDAGEVLQWSDFKGYGETLMGQEHVLLRTDHVSEIPAAVRADVRD